MTRLRELAPIVALPLLVLVIALGAAHLLERPSAGLIGAPAPDVALPIVAGPGAEARDRVALAGMRGQVVLLDFWATWCPPCRQSIPILNRIHEGYAGRGVAVVGINLETGLAPPALASAHATFGASFPSLQDTTGAVQGAYGITDLPTLVLIDREGVVRHVESGVPREARLRDRIDSLLR